MRLMVLLVVDQRLLIRFLNHEILDSRFRPGIIGSHGFLSFCRGKLCGSDGGNVGALRTVLRIAAVALRVAVMVSQMARRRIRRQRLQVSVQPIDAWQPIMQRRVAILVMMAREQIQQRPGFGFVLSRAEPTSGPRLPSRQIDFQPSSPIPMLGFGCAPMIERQYYRSARGTGIVKVGKRLVLAVEMIDIGGSIPTPGTLVLPVTTAA